MTKKFYLTAALLISLIVPNFSYADDEKDTSFLPAWRLLNTEGKQQFVSGYQQGWKDAVKIINIVINYLKTNPEEGIKALESIKKIYDLSGIKPDTLAQEIELFYSEPKNSEAPLSKAITAAKARAE